MRKLNNKQKKLILSLMKKENIRSEYDISETDINSIIDLNNYETIYSDINRFINDEWIKQRNN